MQGSGGIGFIPDPPATRKGCAQDFNLKHTHAHGERGHMCCVSYAYIVVRCVCAEPQYFVRLRTSSREPTVGLICACGNMRICMSVCVWRTGVTSPHVRHPAATDVGTDSERPAECAPHRVITFSLRDGTEHAHTLDTPSDTMPHFWQHAHAKTTVVVVLVLVFVCVCV